MRLIGIILLCTLSVTLLGQRKISNMTEATTVDADAVLPIVQDGANYKATKSNLQKEISDSTRAHNSQIAGIQEQIAGIADYEITITDDGDSVQFRVGDNIVKIATGSSTIIDRTSPTILSAEVGELASDSVVIIFSEAIVTDSVPDTSAIVFYRSLNDDVIVNSLALYSNSMHLKLAESIDSTDGTFAQYILPDTGRIQDASGNYLKATYFGVTNNTKCVQSGPLAHFRFENNTIDEEGNVTLTKSAAASYESGSNLIEGNYSAHTNGADAFFNTSSIEFGNRFTIAIRWKIYFGTSNERVLFSTLDENGDGDGFELKYDRPNDRLEFVTEDGASTTTATSSAISYSSNSNTWSAVAVDRTNGSVKIYHEGVDVTSSGSIETGFDNTDALYFGIQPDSTGEIYGYLDDAQIYLDTLEPDLMDQIYDSPGNSVLYGDCVPSPDPPTDSITIIKHFRFDNVTLDEDGNTVNRNLTTADFLEVDSDFYYLHGENNGIAEEAEFRVVSGDTVLRSIYNQGNCCQETSSGVTPPNDGTGLYTEWDLSSNDTDYDYGCFKFDIYVDSDFDVGHGLKLFAVRSKESDFFISGAGGFSLLHMAYDNDGYLQMQDYTRYFTSSGGELQNNTTTGMPTLTKGQWNEVVFRFYVGTPYNSDGFYEYFVNGQLAARQVGGANISHYPGIQVNRFEIATFAGGDSHAWDAITDSYIDIDDVVFFQFHENYSLFPKTVPSPSGRTMNLNF